MLRRVGSRPELTVWRKHRPLGQLRHSGTKFKFGHFRHAIRHNSDESRLDITKRDLSECNYPWLYIPQRDAEPRHAGIQHPRLDIAGFDHSRLDFAERHTEHHDSGIYFAQRDTEYNDPWIDFATNYGSG